MVLQWPDGASPQESLLCQLIRRTTGFPGSDTIYREEAQRRRQVWELGLADRLSPFALEGDSLLYTVSPPCTFIHRQAYIL